MIQELLHDFVREELNVVLLFLRHVSMVELKEVNDAGMRTIATAHVHRELDVTNADPSGQARFDSCHVVTTVSGTTIRKSWVLNHYSADFEEISTSLSTRLQHDARNTLVEKKLLPKIGLAFPMVTDKTALSGRLFTFLPLPIYTGFPCHVHGLFALTPDRQHLVNAEETGLTAGSLHRSKQFFIH
jgi:hypothetical protein